MNANKHSTPQEGEPDPLNELLAQAQWPPNEADREARLLLHWRRLLAVRSATRRRSPMAALVTVAAGLLIAICSIHFWPSDDLQPSVASSEPSEEAPTALPETTAPVQPLVSPTIEPTQELPPVSRPPTPLEALLVRANRTQVAPLTRTDSPDALVEVALVTRMNTPEEDTDRIATPLLAQREACEAALVWQLHKAQDPGRRAAAIDLLAAVGSRRSIPILLELSRHEATHERAVIALAQLADANSLGQLALFERNPALQQELMAALLTRGDSHSLSVYLRLLDDQRTYRSALAALDATPNPPIEGLFGFFDSPKQRERYAAALALGRLDDPAISQRLMEMVLFDTARREALLALAASDDDQAVLFVNSAGRDPRLKGLVLAARHQAQMNLSNLEEAK